MVSQFFEGVRMLDCPTIPQFRVHGTRRIELLPGGYVCVWQCEDYSGDTAATALFCTPVVKLVLPIQNFLWNVRAVTEWAIQRGFTGIPLRGPIIPLATRH